MSSESISSAGHSSSASSMRSFQKRSRPSVMSTSSPERCATTTLSIEGVSARASSALAFKGVTLPPRGPLGPETLVVLLGLFVDRIVVHVRLSSELLGRLIGANLCVFRHLYSLPLSDFCFPGIPAAHSARTVHLWPALKRVSLPTLS